MPLKSATALLSEAKHSKQLLGKNKTQITNTVKCSDPAYSSNIITMKYLILHFFISKKKLVRSIMFHETACVALASRLTTLR